MKVQEKGMFGEFGGSYVPEDLQVVLDRLADAFKRIKMIQSLMKNSDTT